ncbi:MAG: hypothetical protein VKO39_07430 [Cyanobacteriota bacterium]|nr:hypothetical protein [Cyanobacteriota bacterium]
MIDSRHRSLALLPWLLLALLAVNLLPLPQALAKQKNWLQQFRELLGHNPPLAPGGTRSPTAKQICLISPWINAKGNAVISLPRLTFISTEPLAEWKVLNSRNEPIASDSAYSDKPLPGQITPELPPLPTSQTLKLKLRLWGANGADYSEVIIQTASNSDREFAERILADPQDRLELVSQLLGQGKSALAMELVWEPTRPPSPALRQLREHISKHACQSSENKLSPPEAPAFGLPNQPIPAD